MISVNKQKKSYTKITILSIVVFLMLLISFTGYGYYKAAKVVKNDVDIIKEEIKNIQVAVLPTQDFIQAKESLSEIEKRVRLIEAEVSKLDLPKLLPQTKKEAKAVENILQGVLAVFSPVQKLTDIGAEMYEDLGISGQTWQELDLNKLNSNQKGNIIVAIRQAAPVVQEINQQVNNIEDDIAVLLNSPWAKYINQESLEKIKNLVRMEYFLDLIAEALEYLPEVIGYPVPANYLILLQNNTELRPTGGFIGTYGLLQFRDGKGNITKIDDVYNLDKTVKTTMFVEPPWQLKKWNDTSQWFLRDVNWSPDFPTSAKQAEWFYNEESKEDLEFTGTIAITPDVMADMLDIIGPIIVRDLTFTSKNLVELLEYQVEVEFREQGIPLSQRKIIMAEMALIAQDRLKNLSLDQILDLANIIKRNLNEKHILIYFNNPEIQKIVQARNWTGEIRSAESDYLFVVDANIGSLKTDLVMQKSIDYQVRKDEVGNLIAKVILTYYNDGKFAWNLTRYRTYTRIYTPKGSKLIKAEGMMANDRTKKIGEVATEEEFAKTVFGAFIAIEPKEIKTLTFEYKLPDYIKEQLDRGEYSLLIQKQAGTQGHELRVDILGEVWEGDLAMDREIK
jgi:hypothetical protein